MTHIHRQTFSRDEFKEDDNQGQKEIDTGWRYERSGSGKKICYENSEDEEDDDGEELSTPNSLDKDKLSREDLLRKLRRMIERCGIYEEQVRKLKWELTKASKQVRLTKKSLRAEYGWDGKDANFANTVSTFC